MKEIIFNKDRMEDVSITSQKPILYLVRLSFNTSDRNWFNRIYNAQLLLKCELINDKDEPTNHTASVPYSIGTFLSPNHQHPEIDLKFYEKFNPFSVVPKEYQHFRYRVSYELKYISFEDDESISLTVMDRDYINHRVSNWLSRIDNLYDQIQEWCRIIPNTTSSLGTPNVMNEKLMNDFAIEVKNMPVLNVLKQGELELVIRPKGLWVMGANGRIDILTSKGSRILVDMAENFSTPNWKLYSGNRKENLDFDMTSFKNLIS